MHVDFSALPDTVQLPLRLPLRLPHLHGIISAAPSTKRGFFFNGTRSNASHVGLCIQLRSIAFQLNTHSDSQLHWPEMCCSCCYSSVRLTLTVPEIANTIHNQPTMSGTLAKLDFRFVSRWMAVAQPCVCSVPVSQLESRLLMRHGKSSKAKRLRSKGLAGGKHTRANAHQQVTTSSPSKLPCLVRQQQ